MTSDALPCQSCGQALASPEAVCEPCERAAELAERACRFRCPACQRGFDLTDTALLPASAPWYRAQEQVPLCPHCHCKLRDRRVVKTTRKEVFVYLVLCVGSQFLPGDWLPKAVLVAAYLGFLLLMFLKKPKIASDKDVYVLAGTSDRSRLSDSSHS